MELLLERQSNLGKNNDQITRIEETSSGNFHVYHQTFYFICGTCRNARNEEREIGIQFPRHVDKGRYISKGGRIIGSEPDPWNIFGTFLLDGTRPSGTWLSPFVLCSMC